VAIASALGLFAYLRLVVQVLVGIVKGASGAPGSSPGRIGRRGAERPRTAAVPTT
jgi:hypothetical protein